VLRRAWISVLAAFVTGGRVTGFKAFPLSAGE
jgi:hypothetical protein